MKKWILEKSESTGKYGAIIEERKYHHGGTFYYSRIIGSQIPMDTNYHKSLAAAKSYIRKEIAIKGAKRFIWKEAKNEQR